MSFFPTIMAMGALQGLVLAAALIMRSGHSRADRLLGAWLAAFSLDLGLLLLVRAGWYRYFPHVLNLSAPFTFLYGPAFWFYILFLTGRRRSWRRTDLLHLVPFAIGYGALMPFYLMGGAEKIASMGQEAAVSSAGAVVAAVRIAHGATYVCMGITAAAKRPGSTGTERARGMDPARRWIAWLSGTQVAIWGIAALALVVLFINARAGKALEGLIWPVGAISVQSMAAWALLNGGLFPNRSIDEKAAGGKYRKTRIDPSTLARYEAKIRTVMEEDRPWLDPDLRLEDMASLVGCQPYALSQVVNQVFGMRFTDLVNSRRVREAATLLADRGHAGRGVLEIAFSCGFNSKAVFNAAFKRFSGSTPSEFRSKKGTDS